MRHFAVFVLAALLGVGCGSSSSKGSSGHFDGTFGTAWELLAPLTSASGCPGFTDYTPAGEVGLFSAASQEAARFDPTIGWTPVAAPPINFNCWPGPAWVGNLLYVIRSGAVYAFDTVGGTWSTLVASGVAETSDAQMTHDDSGHVYAVESKTPFRMVRYTIATNAVDYLGTASWNGAEVSEPRIAWDSIAKKLYVAPSYSSQRLFSFDPAAPGTSVELASVPAAAGGIGTGMGDPYCGDRSGHLYAIGDDGCSGSSSVFQYDIATDVWNRLPDLPEDHGCNGACTVSSDGWLYLSPGDSNSLYRLSLGTTSKIFGGN